METKQIALLLATGGLDVELVFDGSPADCPHCDQPHHCRLPEAA
ncbi:MAG: hypothetical protein OEM84_13970 [Acidimicrobiia bacterium]|nr:hypothetical protein [Acidimicrobiia bacterium]